MEDNLNEIFTQCWGKLFYGSIIADNAFHTGVAGTERDGTVNLRTIILRSVNPDDKQVMFYTDARSAKMADLKSNPTISWLFYDHAERIQIRLMGNVIIHHENDVTNYHWGKINNEGRKLYSAVPGPSTGIEHPADGLEHLSDIKINSQSGYSNFSVIATSVNFIEWLSLKKGGHRRAEFRLLDNSWKGQWLIP